MWALFSLLFLPYGTSFASPTHIEKMTVSKMRMADLETSASGYSYNHQQGLPVSIVRYTNHGSNSYYDAPNPLQFVSALQSPLPPPVPHVHAPGLVYPLGLPYAPRQPHLQPGPAYPLIRPQVKAIAPYYVPDKEVGENKNLEVYEDYQENDDDFDDSKELELHDEGNDYKQEEYDEHGEEGEKGFKGSRYFDHGEHGEHASDDHKGHYDEEGGHEKAHTETDAHFEQHEEGEKGEQGSNYGQASYHKKGHKTTGFHNVYRKDEYKKDTDFYDEDHNSGHFDKHSSANQHHDAAQGAYEKGNHRDSGYENTNRAKAGQVDRGRDYSDHQGHEAQKGGESYHRQYSNYGKKGGARFNKGHGYYEH